jgi:hypothetical protein
MANLAIMNANRIVQISVEGETTRGTTEAELRATRTKRAERWENYRGPSLRMKAPEAFIPRD